MPVSPEEILHDAVLQSGHIPVTQGDPLSSSWCLVEDEMGDEYVKRWYALYTKPHKERQVSSLLQEHGIETYLPTVRRKIRRRDRPDRMVYFPCYLFARVDFRATPRSSIAWMPGIRRIVSFGEQPAVVDDAIVSLVRQRLGEIEEVAYGRLKQGDRVRITSGPLRDLEAIFDRPLSAADRVRVLLDVMGRMTPADIDYSDITPL